MGGKLVVCSSCAVHVNSSEEQCPHCGEEVYSGGGGVLGRTAGAVLMGLTLAGCPAGDETGDSMPNTAAYGVPTTDSWTASGSTTDDGSSSTTTGEGDSTGSSTSTGASDSTGASSSTGAGTSSGTGSGTDTGSGGGTTTGTGSTGISPDYGSPATD